MAERTVAVKLMANISQYEAAMRSAASASGRFSAETQSSMKKLGGDMQNVGGTLTRSVTLPLVAAGVGAVKLGLDFDTAFSRMVGLAGVSADAVDGLKESVLDLAAETGQAPVDLANALYEAASAGLDSEQAMKAVGVAARGAAAGMGSAEDIVGLVASATASYGSANIDAAEAVDILTQTIREGRADPQELAGSLGRLLPIAAQMGVTFSEVGGLVAYTTNAFGDTDRALTGVNDTLAKLSAPGEVAKQSLLDMGTSAEELRSTIQEDGLLAGLELLREKGYVGNSDAIRELMPDMQGAATLTLLLNDESGKLTETLGATADSTGARGEAFSTAADTDMFKLRQAWAELQVGLIEAGNVIIPIVTGIVGSIGDLAVKFSNLPEPVQAVVIGFLAFVAAAGPMLSIGGKIISNLGAIVTAMKALSVALLTNPWVAVGAAVVIAGGALVAFATKASDAERAMARAKETAAELGREMATTGPVATLTGYFADLAGENDNLRAAMLASGVTVADLVSAFMSGTGAIAPLNRSLIEAGEAAGLSSDEIRDLADLFVNEISPAVGMTITEFGELEVVQGRASTASEGWALAVKREAAEAVLAAVATGELTGATEDLVPPTEDAAGAADDHANAVQRAKDALDRKRDAAIEAQEALQNLREETIRSAGGAFDLETAEIRLSDAVADLAQQTYENNLIQMDGTKSAEEKAASSRDLRLAELDAAGGALEAAEAFAEQNGAADGSNEKVLLMKDYLGRLQDQFPGLRDEIQRYIDKLNAIPSTKQTTVTTTFLANGDQRLNKGGDWTLAAQGGYFDRQQVGTWAEAGPEAILPLTNPGRMRELVADPRIFGPLMSALGAGGSSRPPTVQPAAGLVINGGIVAADWREAVRDLERRQWVLEASRMGTER